MFQKWMFLERLIHFAYSLRYAVFVIGVLAFALMIRAGLDGIRRDLPLPAPADFNLYTADPAALASFGKLPESYEEACAAARASDFIREHVPSEIIDIYCSKTGA